MDVIAETFINISGYRCLSLSDIVIGILNEGMDLVIYVLIVGKSFLWSFRHKGIKSDFLRVSRIERQSRKIDFSVILPNCIPLNKLIQGKIVFSFNDLMKLCIYWLVTQLGML